MAPFLCLSGSEKVDSQSRNQGSKAYANTADTSIITMMRNRSYASQPSLSFGPGGLSPMIRTLLIINVAVFLLQYFFPIVTQTFGLVPADFFSKFPTRIYQIFTYMFLHAGLFHIFFNMFNLWMFGTEVEYNLGSKSFIKFYIACGLVGGLLHTIVFNSGQALLLGASGAIYGVMIAYWLMFPERELYLYFVFPVKVKYAIPGLMIIGFLFAAPNVAHLCHLGGAICGFVWLKLDWRIDWFSRKVKDLRYRKLSAKLDKRRQDAEEMMKKVDAILDKINDVGIENLSKEERAFLEDASSKMSRHNDLKET